MTDKEVSREYIYGAQLNEELEKWRVLGMSVDTWFPSGGILAGLVRIEVMMDALVDAGILAEEDMKWNFREKYLGRLKMIRAELEPKIQEAKLNAIRQGNLRKH